MADNPNNTQDKKISQSQFWLSFKKPWKLICKNKMAFFLWFIFTIFAGQIGIILNIIIRVINGKSSLQDSLYLDSISGSFYTYSIALIASILGPMFVNFIENSPTNFRSIKIFIITISIFTLFFAGVFYSTSIDNPVNLKHMKYAIDWWQLSFLMISVLISVYCFNVFKLDMYEKEFADINDNYVFKEDQARDDLEKKSSNLIQDSKGNAI